MEVYKAKRGMYPLSFFVTLILLNAYCFEAAILVESNTTFGCDGHLGECLIEDDLELEFLMNPYVSRILDDGKNHGTSRTPDRNQAAIACDRLKNTPQYASCISPKKGQNHHCDPRKSGYNRDPCR